MYQPRSYRVWNSHQRPGRKWSVGALKSSTLQHPHGEPQRLQVTSSQTGVTGSQSQFAGDLLPEVTHDPRIVSGPGALRCPEATPPKEAPAPGRARFPGGARHRELLRVTWRGRGLSGCGGRATEHPGSPRPRGGNWRGRGGEGLAPARRGVVLREAGRSARPPSPGGWMRAGNRVGRRARERRHG